MSRDLAPAYGVIQQSGNLAFQARMLFRDSNSEAAKLFIRNNIDTPWLIPGQLVIIADPTSAQTMKMLDFLRQARQRTNRALIGISPDEAMFMQRHYGLISALTTAGNNIFGTVGSVGEKYFLEIENILQKIEVSYQNQYRSQGRLTGQQFFIERKQLFNQLKELVNKPLLKSLKLYTLKFKPYEDMRRALNLSSRSIVHEWSTVGLGGIPGYSSYISNAAKAAKYLKAGGYIGIGFSLIGATNEVINACTYGRENECKRIAFKEYSKFGVTTLSSLGTGVAGSAIGLSVCAAIGIATAGTGAVVCAAVGTIAGGYLGAKSSDAVMDTIYDYMEM
ncbi:membrane protein [bacteria symbiont BFo2 of Frankliniella occidentalis]|nr:membrane protein [bacteria symbiont BFo2 of Frankliniella occidentalis]